MRWLDKAGAPHWQCSSAPSSVVNNMYFFEHISASNWSVEQLEYERIFD